MARFGPWFLGLCLLGLGSGGAGCVDTYSGTRLQMNLSVAGSFDRTFLILPTPGLQPGDAGYFSHYELHANIGGHGLVRLATFIIQPSIEVDNPCLQFLKDEFCIPTDTYDCGYMNPKRFAAMEAVLAIVSSPTTRPADAIGEDSWSEDATGFVHWPGYNFTQWPDYLFLDPEITVAASKLDRENLDRDEVEAFCSELPKGYYLANGVQLTSPLNGRLMGVVDSTDPRTGSKIGGITLMVPGKVYGMTELILIRERDPKRIAGQDPDNAGRTDLLPSDESEVMLVGQQGGVYGSIQRDQFRGVTTVQMVSPYGLPINMNVAIFEDIDEDPINF